MIKRALVTERLLTVNGRIVATDVSNLVICIIRHCSSLKLRLARVSQRIDWFKRHCNLIQKTFQVCIWCGFNTVYLWKNVVSTKRAHLMVPNMCFILKSNHTLLTSFFRCLYLTDSWTKDNLICCNFLPGKRSPELNTIPSPHICYNLIKTVCSMKIRNGRRYFSCKKHYPLYRGKNVLRISNHVINQDHMTSVHEICLW